MSTDLMSDTRQKVMRHLLDRRGGSTVDELVANLGLSRTAVNQHLAVLERANLGICGAWPRANVEHIRLNNRLDRWRRGGRRNTRRKRTG